MTPQHRLRQHLLDTGATDAAGITRHAKPRQVNK